MPSYMPLIVNYTSVGVSWSSYDSNYISTKLYCPPVDNRYLVVFCGKKSRSVVYTATATAENYAFANVYYGGQRLKYGHQTFTNCTITSGSPIVTMADTTGILVNSTYQRGSNLGTCAIASLLNVIKVTPTQVTLSANVAGTGTTSTATLVFQAAAYASIGDVSRAECWILANPPAGNNTLEGDLQIRNQTPNTNNDSDQMFLSAYILTRAGAPTYFGKVANTTATLQISSLSTEWNSIILSGMTEYGTWSWPASTFPSVFHGTRAIGSSADWRLDSHIRHIVARDSSYGGGANYGATAFVLTKTANVQSGAAIAVSFPPVVTSNNTGAIITQTHTASDYIAYDRGAGSASWNLNGSAVSGLTLSGTTYTLALTADTITQVTDFSISSGYRLNITGNFAWWLKCTGNATVSGWITHYDGNASTTATTSAVNTTYGAGIGGGRVGTSNTTVGPGGGGGGIGGTNGGTSNFASGYYDSSSVSTIDNHANGRFFGFAGLKYMAPILSEQVVDYNTTTNVRSIVWTGAQHCGSSGGAGGAGGTTGGGNTQTGQRGGQGGGAVRITATIITINGRVDCAGETPTVDWNSGRGGGGGGGSGGSILLEGTNSVAGSGSILAYGGFGSEGAVTDTIPLPINSQGRSSFGIDCRITVSAVSVGAITAFTIAAAGSGYKVGDKLHVGNATTMVTGLITVTTINGSGGVTAATLTLGGNGYVAATVYPTVSMNIYGVNTQKQGSMGGGGKVEIRTSTNNRSFSGTIDVGTDYLTLPSFTVSNSSGVATAAANTPYLLMSDTGVTSTTSGSGAYWNFLSTGSSGATWAGSIVMSKPGNGRYNVGDTVRILGTQFPGGATPANDLVFTVGSRGHCFMPMFSNTVRSKGTTVAGNLVAASSNNWSRVFGGTGSISGNTLTLTASADATMRSRIRIGNTVEGAGVTAGTTITGYGDPTEVGVQPKTLYGDSAAGRFAVSISQTVASTGITINQYGITTPKFLVNFQLNNASNAYNNYGTLGAMELLSYGSGWQPGDTIVVTGDQLYQASGNGDLYIMMIPITINCQITTQTALTQGYAYYQQSSPGVVVYTNTPAVGGSPTPVKQYLMD